jgi:FKBP-type peptidyl-prolyl cis-trans isomerase
MRKAGLLLVILLSPMLVRAAEDKIRGVLEKTNKPGACAQITDAVSDTYYVVKSDEAEKLVADFVGKNIRVTITGTVEEKKDDPAFYFNLKAVEKYELKLPPAPAAGESTDKNVAFLAENKRKDGVITTASGLQYKILKEGTGETPAATDTVKVHYRGTTIDGVEFDSSYKRNEPTTFPLNGVIKGWTEGLQLMKVGSKFQFVIPSELAYGKQGSPPKIGPDATLIFEVELLAIEK